MTPRIAYTKGSITELEVAYATDAAANVGARVATNTSRALRIPLRGSISLQVRLCLDVEVGPREFSGARLETLLA